MAQDLTESVAALSLENSQEKSLSELITVLNSNDVVDIQKVLEAGLLDQLYKLVQPGSKHQEKAAQVVAELAKTESTREPCVKAGLPEPLLNMLTLNNIPSVTQACRALGNICFDNNVGRDAIDQMDGVSRLIGLLKTYEDSTADGADRLRMVSCGFLLNLTNTHGMALSSCNIQEPLGLQKVQSEEGESIRMITLRLKLNPNANQETIQERAIALGALELMDSYLKKHSGDEGLCQMALMCVGSLTDADIGREKLSECEVAVTIGKLLAMETGQGDLRDTVLEMLSNLAESDDVKFQLASSDLKQQLVTMVKDVEKEEDEDSLQQLKLASDLIILLLTGDSCMEVLYQDGQGLIYKESRNWLKSNSEHLQMSGALAIGNFARNDDRCCFFVREGVTEELLALLKPGVSAVASTVQHAVFSALRNLAIPAVNKSTMLGCGLMDAVLPFMASEMNFVQFKLLGLLRMVIDGQKDAAIKAGTNCDFLDRLITFCAVEDHAGVKGEANRLVAWLVKHSANTDVMKCILKANGVPHIVNMMNAEHAVMQNEALMALTLMATSCIGQPECVVAFKEAELVPGIKVVITDDNTLPEILCNTLTLIKGLASSGEMTELMKLIEIPDIVSKFSKHEDSNVKTLAKTVSSVLGKG